MDMMEQLSRIGIVPVIAINDAAAAVRKVTSAHGRPPSISA